MGGPQLLLIFGFIYNKKLATTLQVKWTLGNVVKGYILKRILCRICGYSRIFCNCLIDGEESEIHVKYKPFSILQNLDDIPGEAA